MFKSVILEFDVGKSVTRGHERHFGAGVVARITGDLQRPVRDAMSKGYFMPFDQFPWFRDAKISDILEVELINDHHLRWDRLWVSGH